MPENPTNATSEIGQSGISAVGPGSCAARSLALVTAGLLRIDDVMEFFRISRSTVYKLMELGELPWVKIGRARRVPRRAVEELAARALRGGQLLPGEEPADA